MNGIGFGSVWRLGMVAGAAAVAVVLSGCAASGGGTGQPSGDTRATLLITADNNAQIPIVHLNLATVTLVKADGTTVPLLTTPQTVELGSLNGVARPLVTATVPQGTPLDSATAFGRAERLCEAALCGTAKAVPFRFVPRLQARMGGSIPHLFAVRLR